MADDPTYADLNALLAAYTGMSGIVSQLLELTADLSTLALEVKLQAINALLLARAPDVLDPEDERFPLFLEALNGASAEVEVITGPNPQPAQRRNLALRAIALGTAADLEESLFPEQQFGDQARAVILRRRYDAVLALLRLPRDEQTGVVPDAQVLSPSGSFPPAQCYPDPAIGGPWGSWTRPCW